VLVLSKLPTRNAPRILVEPDTSNLNPDSGAPRWPMVTTESGSFGSIRMALDPSVSETRTSNDADLLVDVIVKSLFADVEFNSNPVEAPEPVCMNLQGRSVSSRNNSTSAPWFRTVNLASGLIVPIPTLPDDDIYMLLVLSVLKTIPLPV